MLENNEAFAFLAAIGFVTHGSKVTFSGVGTKPGVGHGFR